MTFTLPDRFNMVRYFLEHNLEAGRGRTRALWCRGRDGSVREYDYAQVVAATNRAGRLLIDLGVEPEQRVLLAIGDGLEWVAAWFAAIKIGAIACSVNPLLPADDYAYYLDYTRAKVALCDLDSAPRMLEVLPQARHLRALLVTEHGSTPSAPAGARATIVNWNEAHPSQPDRLDVADTWKDDVAVWLFTSGTTGKPKAAVHFHHDFVFNAEHYAKDVLRLTPNDRTLGVPKLFFGYATGTNLLFPFAAGACVGLFQDKSKPDVILDQIRRFHPTVLCAVPTALNGLLALENAARADFEGMRYATSAGEALPPELYHRFIARFGVEILDGIGSAEMFHVFISNYPGKVRPGTLGTLVPGYEARLVGPDGRDAPAGEPGTLWIKGGSAALQYYAAREKSRATFLGDWVVTADQFRLDADAFFHYEGRTDDMLKVGGIFVSPLEIESCLLQHPAVREVAVIGYTEDDLVKPEAFVVVNASHSASTALAQELQSFVKTRLAPYKYPRRVSFLDALPRNDRGKCEKKLLRGGPSASAGAGA
ncbi:MAG: benzoate-CoA ligase family protein [Planctomycetes bacterium]|nr:benzoate-CoA ligase family protein [Planctomycetota bacterium]